MNVVSNASSNNKSKDEKLIRLLEEQLAHSNQQNKKLSKKLDQSLKQIESLTQQLQHLTKLLYGSKTEKSKYNTPDGQVSLFEDDPSFTDSEHTEEQSQQTISYTVVRNIQKKKRNDSLRDDVEIEAIHHHPDNTICDCCQHQMVEIGGTVVREEATFIPAKMMKVQHIEHAYECRNCKSDASQSAQIKRGKVMHHNPHKLSVEKHHSHRFNVASQALACLRKSSMINLRNTYPFTARSRNGHVMV
ncbi:IS66 family transposase zinc-finger binding domain-containing protein [Cytobacillus oceanisediminis]|uniref:IS66 family transposase zinc-finger binding domain-containing protein n=1 Tax=Cytobacillus oceanisediminis TaxID=665099 RepID=UPI001CCCB8F2|nr:IS66 family transposase zinc-finger binding domain-containing protein [Cytobacillus oceanisediminis]